MSVDKLTSGTFLIAFILLSTSFCQNLLSNSAQSGNTLTFQDFVEIDLQAALIDFLSLPSDLEHLDKVPASNVKYFQYKDSKPFQIESINISAPTKFIVHGWKENATLPWVERMALNFLEKGVDVVSVDWSKDAFRFNYVHSATHVKAVGELLGGFILKQTKDLGLVHVLGHSLGAHVGGFAGKFINARGRGKIDRITGLDPAGPLFEIPLHLPCTQKLCKGDAEFVDVIHSNRGVYGGDQDYGDVDFFVNGEKRIQPGCGSLNLQAAILCSHQMSNEYYSESITDPKRFPGERCTKAGNDSEEVFMGDGVERTATGSFCVYTDYTAATGA